jgi:hypothetical protein
MTQIGFRRSEAHEALDDFLAGDRMERWIADGEDLDGSQTLAYIVPGEGWEKIKDGYHAWHEIQEVRDDAVHEPEGYHPFRYSPLNMGGDRLLPVEPAQEHLSRIFFGKAFSELDRDDESKVRAAAVMCVLDTRLDPDGQGAVPILALGTDHDEPGPSLRWQMAFVTGVHGLYVRVTSAGIFGEEFGIVTGSGYRLASGWYDREVAERACEALGRVLPDTDWMRMTPGQFTPAAVKAVRQVIKRYHYIGLQEDEPETVPEPEPEAQS